MRTQDPGTMNRTQDLGPRVSRPRTQDPGFQDLGLKIQDLKIQDTGSGTLDNGPMISELRTQRPRKKKLTFVFKLLNASMYSVFLIIFEKHVL